MGKSTPESFTPHEVEQMARQQNRMNNPNVSNIFGSTTTEFGADDQAQITQELSPEMQAIINSQMDFVGQGPAQLGNFNNPFLSQMMQGAADNISRRWGRDSPDATGFSGGFASQMPTFNTGNPEQPGGGNPSPPTGPVNPGGGGIDNADRDYREIPGAGMGGGGFGGSFAFGLNNMQQPTPDLIQKDEKSGFINRSHKAPPMVGGGISDNKNAQEQARLLGIALQQSAR